MEGSKGDIHKGDREKHPENIMKTCRKTRRKLRCPPIRPFFSMMIRLLVLGDIHSVQLPLLVNVTTIPQNEVARYRPRDRWEQMSSAAWTKTLSDAQCTICRFTKRGTPKNHPEFLRWHVCRVNFARETFLGYEFSYEKCSEIFPEIFCGSEEKSRKIPAKFPTKIPCEKSKKFTDELLSAGAQGE